MRIGSRVHRLEAKAVPEEARIIIVYEAEAGVWTTYEGETVTRASIPATAQVIVFRLRPDGPQ